MRTIKLVIIGDSGVGKTSFRSQYILGRFSTGYRATIGTDFITKTLPHHKDPSESVTLQIWDTAGQERFSSLSSAFFRGADAALLMFDVNRPETLAGLARWWAEFRACAPVLDADARDYCVVVVGNKVDLDPDRGADVHMGAEGGGVAGLEGLPLLLQSQSQSRPRVSEAEAERFLEELVPPVEASSDDDEYEGLDEDVGADMDDPFVVREGEGENEHTDARTSAFFLRPSISGFSLHSVYPRRRVSTNAEDFEIDVDYDSETESPQRPRTQSISIQRGGSGGRLAPPHPDSLHVSKSHASDRSQLVGTMSTMRTTHTLYHTPASSLFGTDAFESAPSSPLLSRSHSHDGSYDEPGPWGGSSPALATTPGARAPRRMTSSSSTSSVPTITPSLFMRAQASASPSAAPTPPTPVEAHGNGDGGAVAHFPFARSAPAPPVSQSASTSAQFTSARDGGRSRRRVHLLPRPERGPRLFFTSAKTGAGVAPVFEYIAQRVTMHCEYVEAREALTGGPHHDDTLRLADARSTAGSSSISGGFGWVRVPDGVTCCGS
ncbi:hypothetical protein M0805_001853 [Coniferiporia weirii]|nr:hypothetical protein M0805_001853 [Coniferiporia weirii]